jgi:hypothetical protein
MNDGKYFEGKTHAVIKKLNPSKEVLPDVQIKGKLSESSRQVDVVLRSPTEYDFIAFECKDEKASIGTPTVEAYYTKLMDIGAKHGAIVSNSPYTKGARNMAAKLKIDLLHLVDTDDDQIKTKLLAPSAVVHERVTQWNVMFQQPSLNTVPSSSLDYSTLMIKLPNSSPMQVKELANIFWNEIAERHKDGQYARDFTAASLFTLGDERPLPPLRIVLDVNNEYRLGTMDITQSKGIYNVKDGSYQTSSMAVGAFGVEIFESWREISKEQLEKIQPSFILTTRTDLTSSNPSTEVRL